MKIIDSFGKDDLAKVYVADFGDDRIAEFVESRQPPIPIEDKWVLKLDNANKIILEETFKTKLLKIISDPNIAYILMMIGFAGLYFGLTYPGTFFPGVIGAISLTLAFFAFQTLPVNYTGVLLIILSIIMFILEIKITSYGLLSTAGITLLLLGSLMLFESGAPGQKLSLIVFVATAVSVFAFFNGVERIDSLFREIK